MALTSAGAFEFIRVDAIGRMTGQTGLVEGPGPCARADPPPRLTQLVTRHTPPYPTSGR